MCIFDFRIRETYKQLPTLSIYTAGRKQYGGFGYYEGFFFGGVLAGAYILKSTHTRIPINPQRNLFT